MRPAPVRLLAADARLLAAVSVKLREPRALVAPLGERLLVLRTGALTRSLVLAPTAGELVHALRARLELDDPVDRLVEEGAVVRDEHHTALDVDQESLQELEAGEVEVVRRLVEEVDVVAREQNRGECGTGRLSTRQLRDAALERSVEAGSSQRRTGARLELDRWLLGGPPGEVGEQALAFLEVPPLRQVAHLQARWVAPDGAGVELLETGERPQQRRLAAPVRADDADPAAGRDRERDAFENRVGSAVNS